MDVFKFAFETSIVGLLALPWLLILVDLIAPGSLTNGHENGTALWASVPDSIRPTVASVLLFAVIYLVGSAVSPLAKDTLDDDDLSLFHKKLPTESGIRKEVYCQHHAWVPDIGHLLPQDLRYPERSAESKANASTEIFRAQETAILIEGEVQSQRTRQLHEQIIVLQGAAFSCLLCSLLSVFGWSAVKWPRSIWSAIAPTLISAFAAVSLYKHIANGFRFDDPPLMEFVLGLTGLVGLWIVFRPPKARRFGTWALVAALLGLIAFGGWWWSQVTYDEHVIHSFAAITGAKHPDVHK